MRGSYVIPRQETVSSESGQYNVPSTSESHLVSL